MVGKRIDIIILIFLHLFFLHYSIALSPHVFGYVEYVFRTARMHHPASALAATDDLPTSYRRHVLHR